MACGACAEKNKKESFIHTDKVGNKTTYKTEVEARGAVARKGGTYKKVSK